MNVAAIMEPLVFVAFCWLTSFPNDQHYHNTNASFQILDPSKCCGHCYAGMQQQQCQRRAGFSSGRFKGLAGSVPIRYSP